jgi:hypothetical protein
MDISVCVAIGSLTIGTLSGSSHLDGEQHSGSINYLLASILWMD